MTPSNIQTDIAVIKEQLIELNKKMDRYMTKVDRHDVAIAEVETKIVNFNSFQTFLTFIGTAAASALAFVISRK